MSDPQRPAAPGERRLDHPPSDRYLEPAATAATADTASATGEPGSVGKAVGLATVVALVGVAATVVLGGIVGVSAGLLVVAGATGWLVGLGAQTGAGTTVASRRRVLIAVVVAFVGVVLGQLGLWLYARTEGGVLTLPDYLAQTFGLLVPLQAILAVGLAWWRAR